MFSSGGSAASRAHIVCIVPPLGPMLRLKPERETVSPRPYTFASKGRADASCSQRHEIRSRHIYRMQGYLEVLIFKYQREAV